MMADIRKLNIEPTPPKSGDSDSTERILVPKGQYLASVTDSIYKETKSGNGHYIELEFTILEGDQENLRVWAKFNVDNPSQQAVKIAIEQLGNVAYAAGLSKTPSDTEDFHGIPMWISVDIENGYNCIKRYEPQEEGLPIPTQSKPKPSQTDFDEEDDAIPF